MKNIKPLNREPWVGLEGKSQLKNWTHRKEVAYNQQLRQALKYEFFIKAVDFIADNKIPGDYHEYGCHRARTFRMVLTEVAKKSALSGMNFFAFDSFAGLPTVTSNPDIPLWKRGALATSEKEFLRMIRQHGLGAGRVRAVPGFYDQSLTPTLQKKFQQEEQPIALATIDCDLYESAVPVFGFLEPLLQEGSVLYLDDLFTGYRGSPVRGVSLAFEEFRQRSRFKFAEHMQVGWWGRSYITYQG
jgi:hypothetical protein